MLAKPAEKQPAQTVVKTVEVTASSSASKKSDEDSIDDDDTFFDIMQIFNKDR